MSVVSVVSRTPQRTVPVTALVSGIVGATSMVIVILLFGPTSKSPPFLDAARVITIVPCTSDCAAPLTLPTAVPSQLPSIFGQDDASTVGREPASAGSPDEPSGALFEAASSLPTLEPSSLPL